MTLQTARSSSISWIDASLDLRLPYKFVHLFPSYIETSRAVYLWTNIWRRTRLRTPCIVYHSECYKILPGEITLISRWAYFHFTPSSFIIYQTKSTRFLRVQRSSTTWPDDSDTFNHVLLLLFWFSKVHLKTTTKKNNKRYGVSVRNANKTGSCCCKCVEKLCIEYWVACMLVPTQGSTFELCKHERSQGMRSKWWMPFLYTER